MTAYGGIEAGGSKWECAVGTGPDDLRATETVPTTTPEETLGRVVAFFEREGPVEAIGVGSFGPVDRKPGSPTWGHITTTPKPGWAHTDVGPEIRRRLSVPVAFDTDVNAAALGEQRWGGHAELVTVPARNVVPKPADRSWAECAAFPLATLTALPRSGKAP